MWGKPRGFQRIQDTRQTPSGCGDINDFVHLNFSMAWVCVQNIGTRHANVSIHSDDQYDMHAFAAYITHFVQGLISVILARHVIYVSPLDGGKVREIAQNGQQHTIVHNTFRFPCAGGCICERLTMRQEQELAYKLVIFKD